MSDARRRASLSKAFGGVRAVNEVSFDDRARASFSP